jgi:alpha-1,2-mannosyltransferase
MWWDRSRLTLYVGALAVGLWASWIVFVLLSTGATAPTGRVGGDFPAFWGAGKLVLEGRAGQIWDFAAQFEVQDPLFPDADEMMPFPYAPPFALIFVPLAMLPYRLAYVVYTLAMVGLTWLAVAGLVRLLPRLGPWRHVALLGALGFPPLFRASAQGQNTAIVLCLLVWVFVALREDRPLLAGVLLGLLWFKATYAAPLTGLLLLDRRWRTLATVAATLATGWVISAAMVGPDWFGRWIEAAMAVQDFNFAVNLGSTVSVVELAWEGLPAPAGTAIGLALLAAIALGTIVVWRRVPTWPARLAVVPLATLAMAPHAYWYDLGLMVAPLGVLAAVDGRRSLPWLAAPVVATLPLLLDVRLGPAWVLLVLVYLARVVWVTSQRPVHELEASPVRAGPKGR